ncbi:MAG: leucine-rich repeat protein [Prevotella sp.]|nr:leucine-rich repeat protein [Candidatus Prevotella equi]
MEKRHYKFFLTMLLLFATIAAHAYDFYVDGLYYNKTSNTEVSVTYKNSNDYSYSGSIEIPANVSYGGVTYSVTSIGRQAFQGCSGLTSVTIGNSVTSIGSGAFNVCPGLTSVTIPNSVTSIGSYAFRGCSALTSIKVDATNKYFDSRNNCNAIINSSTNELIAGCKNTIIPNSVTSIGNYSFSGCSGLTSVTIPNSVTSIGGSAFSGCSGLTSVTIPNSVTSIRSGAFYGCSGLTSLTIPNSVTSIEGSAFQDCSGLTSVTIPNSVTSIGSNTFYRCSGLTSVTIPNSVTSIGSNTFWGCSGLTSVTIPNSVTSIINYAFRGCSGLTSVTIPNSVTSIGDETFSSCSGLTSVTIGNNVTSIGSNAFYCCFGLKIVINYSDLNITKGSNGNGYVAYYADKVINATEQMVNDGDFLYSDSEKTKLLAYMGASVSVEIPNSVKEIEEYSFAGNTKLTSLRLGSNVQKIGTNAFKSCTNLVKVFIMANTKPEGLETALDNVGGRQTYVANNNYDGITTLGAININSNLSSMFAVNGVKYIPISMSARTCEAVDATYAAEDTEISIDQTVSYRNIAFKVPSVKPHVLRNNPYVKSLNINVANIVPNYAFAGCDQLATVTIGENVTELSTGCFDGDKELQTVNISDGETALGLSTNTFRSGKLAQLHQGRDLSYTAGNNATTYSPFSSMTTLQQVEIGEKVKEIKDYTFAGCEALNKFSNTSQYTLRISPSITRIGAHAFDGVKDIQNITIETSSTPIEIASGVFSKSGVRKLYVGRDIKCDALPQPFADCTDLEELEFAKDVTTINEYAYTNTAIKTLTLPEKTAVLSAGAFYKCGNLTSVTIPECVTTIGEKCFGESGLLSVEIGKNVETIGNSAFENSKQLTYVSVAAESIGNSAFAGGSKLQEAVLSDRCKSIGSGAFKDCAALTKINIPTGNTVIDEEVFANCSALSEIVLPESITAINRNAFNGTALTSLIIPAAVTTIGNTAFANTRNLTTVVFNAGKDAVNVANDAFDGMGVKTLTLNRQLDYNTSGKSPLSDNKTLTSVEMGEQPTSLLKGMFKGCTTLLTAKVGVNVKAIEESAFEGCSELISVNVPSGVTTLNSRTFYDCSSLTSIVLPKSVTSVGEYVFANSGIQSFEAENTIERIGLGTFNGCKALKSFVAKSGTKTLELSYNASNKGLFADCPLESVNIDRPISYDTQAAKGYSPFYRSTTLKSVTMGNNPASIPANMFYGCSALSDVAIGNGVTSIGDYAFSGCISLKDFSFGKSVKTIGNEAFSDCTALTRLVSKASVPPTCGSQALEDIDKWECTLYVPEESKEAYMAANQWMDFFFVEDFVEITMGDVDGDGDLTMSDVRKIMNAFLGMESVDVAIADVNGDGKVTMADANEVVNMYLANHNPEPEPEPEPETISVSELSLNKTSLSFTLNNGTSTEQLTASVKPDNATNKEVEWTTSNSNVATVSNTGLVTAVGAGECVITSTAKDGSGVKAECQVKVEKSKEEGSSTDVTTLFNSATDFLCVYKNDSKGEVKFVENYDDFGKYVTKMYVDGVEVTPCGSKELEAGTHTVIYRTPTMRAIPTNAFIHIRQMIEWRIPACITSLYQGNGFGCWNCADVYSYNLTAPISSGSWIFNSSTNAPTHDYACGKNVATANKKLHIPNSATGYTSHPWTQLTGNGYTIVY